VEIEENLEWVWDDVGDRVEDSVEDVEEERLLRLSAPLLCLVNDAPVRESSTTSGDSVSALFVRSWQ
jgi:hypothetical protein